MIRIQIRVHNLLLDLVRYRYSPGNAFTYHVNSTLSVSNKYIYKFKGCIRMYFGILAEDSEYSKRRSRESTH
jgi:hypothetical protein